MRGWLRRRALGYRWWRIRFALNILPRDLRGPIWAAVEAVTRKDLDDQLALLIEEMGAYVADDLTRQLREARLIGDERVVFETEKLLRERL
jgi:hypothetical protein